MENKVKVGKIVNTFGIKGELKVKAMTDFPDERFAKGAHVFLQYHGETLSFEIDSHRVHKGFDMISFVDMRDINLVEKYKGLMLYANKEDITLEDDEVWASDLIDCEVYDKGVLIGTVSDFYNQGVQDLLVINHNGKDIMIPYVDAFIKNKDVENKRIDVELIEGFINED